VADLGVALEQLGGEHDLVPKGGALEVLLGVKASRVNVFLSLSLAAPQAGPIAPTASATSATAAPSLFGDRVEDFASEVRALPGSRSPKGIFWDWPGDTEVILARKPG
jgi:hypothetical protein